MANTSLSRAYDIFQLDHSAISGSHHEFMQNFGRAIYGYFGILRPIFSSDTHISTPHSVYTSIFHKLTAAILNFDNNFIKNVQMCQFAHINRDISCINILQKSFIYPFPRFHCRRSDYIDKLYTIYSCIL